jgi:surface protein
MDQMFRQTGLQMLDASNWDVSKVTDMSLMFGQTKLTSLDVTGWDVRAVKTMHNFLQLVSTLTTLDISGFHLDACTDTSGMFTNCSKLTALNVSNFGMGNVVNMKDMFNTCSALSNLTGLDQWNTTKVQNMENVFMDCRALTTLDLSAWDYSAVTTMRKFCGGASALTTVNFGTPASANLLNMEAMFQQCIALVDCDISGFDVSAVTTMKDMFVNAAWNDAQYVKALNAFAAQTVQNGVLWEVAANHGGAQAAYDKLTDPNGTAWVITDGGP